MIARCLLNGIEHWAWNIITCVEKSIHSNPSSAKTHDVIMI